MLPQALLCPIHQPQHRDDLAIRTPSSRSLNSTLACSGTIALSGSLVDALRGHLQRPHPQGLAQKVVGSCLPGFLVCRPPGPARPAGQVAAARPPQVLLAHRLLQPPGAALHNWLSSKLWLLHGPPQVLLAHWRLQPSGETGLLDVQGARYRLNRCLLLRLVWPVRS